MPYIVVVTSQHNIDRGLVDLGASINLLPYAVYQHLDLGELKLTTMTIQLVDKSVHHPNSIVEDVLIRIKSFFFSMDFVITETTSVANTSSQHLF